MICLRTFYGLLTDYLRIIMSAYVLFTIFIRVVLQWLYGLLRAIASILRVVTSTLQIYTYTLSILTYRLRFWEKV